jgi:hypothetical protein
MMKKFILCSIGNKNFLNLAKKLISNHFADLCNINGSATNRKENKSRSTNQSHKCSIETEVITKNINNESMVTCIRSHVNSEVAAARQRRSISMLFVVVLEFFICWTPIYTINTIAIYSPNLIYKGLGYNGISFFHLLAFFSSCTNPIIYCFMSSKFRENFLSLFRCKNSNEYDLTSISHKSYSIDRSNNFRAQNSVFI